MDTGIAPGVTYYFRVRAQNGVGWGSYGEFHAPSGLGALGGVLTPYANVRSTGCGARNYGFGRPAP